MLGLASLGTAMTAMKLSAQGQIASTESWDDVVAAGKKEGVVVWSFFGAPGAAVERQAREFEQIYGIRVELAPGRTATSRRAGMPSALRASRALIYAPRAVRRTGDLPFAASINRSARFPRRSSLACPGSSIRLST
jgi:hypothetical protein